METPPIKIDEKYVKSKKRQFVYFLIDMVFFMWVASRIDIRDIYFFIALVLLITIITIQMVFDRSAMRVNYRCPVCNKKTDIPINIDETIKLYCPNCNIIWDLQETPSKT